ncbi:hypothetical protein ACG873_13225 [Mesorhizobium sp. AaZ16]|uniref:hypothetical protein n=1 Tax=Mesorhizobium sp. AaZ16 TaxID=3402289 RepID=UPI00374E8463
MTLDTSRDLDEFSGVGGQLLKRELIVLRLGGLAKADLIGRNDAVARHRQHVDGHLPGPGAEVFTVQ